MNEVLTPARFGLQGVFKWAKISTAYETGASIFIVQLKNLQCATARSSARCQFEPGGLLQAHVLSRFSLRLAHLVVKRERSQARVVVHDVGACFLVRRAFFDNLRAVASDLLLA